MQKMKRPFIFDGLDGSGKTTLVQSIALVTGMSIIPRLSLIEDAGIKDKIRNKNISVDTIHKLYMSATHVHLMDLILPKIESGEKFLIDRWIAGMLTMHVLRGGTLAHWTTRNYDWSPIKAVDCIFVRASEEVRKQRIMCRGSLTKSDRVSFHKDAETIHLQFAQRFYRRVILLEATNLNPDELLAEALRVLDI